MKGHQKAWKKQFSLIYNENKFVIVIGKIIDSHAAKTEAKTAICHTTLERDKRIIAI